MKKLLTIIVIAMSANVFAQEGLSDVASEAQFQKNVTEQIRMISNMNSKRELVNYVSTSCSKIATEQPSEEVFTEIKTDCRKKLEVLEAIDLQTAKDQMIAEFQEIQSAGMHMFGLTKNLGHEMNYFGADPIILMLLPFAIVADIALLPFTFVSSMITGF